MTTKPTREAAERKLMDAGMGQQGTVFSLVTFGDKSYVHVNVSKGYLVFKATEEADPINVEVNNFLADHYEQGREQSERRLSPEQEQQMWTTDERPDDPDNPCDVCKARMPLNALTAIFGCHYECRDKEAA